MPSVYLLKVARLLVAQKETFLKIMCVSATETATSAMLATSARLSNNI